MQFKTIDEICVIGESNAKELKKYFEQNNEENTPENMGYRNTFMNKYNETIRYIKSIDELIYFKTQYKDWIDYISKDKNKSDWIFPIAFFMRKNKFIFCSTRRFSLPHE